MALRPLRCAGWPSRRRPARAINQLSRLVPGAVEALLDAGS
jgi:hypothetical protein